LSPTSEIRKIHIVYPEAPEGDPSAKAPTIDHGAALIGPERYYAKAEADLEWDKFWTKVWCFVGVTHDLEKVGDYIRMEVGRESFVVVRAQEDRIQAYYNVCPHRGNWLVYDDRGQLGKGGAFYCNFHGWRFNFDGSVREVKDRELFRDETLCGMRGLTEVRCEVWNSLVFINMDPDAKPLAEQLGVVKDHLSHARFDRMRVYSEMMSTIDANWKIGLDAFVEFYHADNTHPQVLPITSTLKTQYDLYDHGMSRMIIEVGRNGDRSPNPDEVSDALKGFAVSFWGDDPDLYADLRGQEYRIAHASALRKWAERNGHMDLFDKMTDGQVADDWNYHIFPSITLNVFSWGVLIQSWLPHATDPEKHVYRSLSLLLPVKDPNQHVMDPASFGVSATAGWNGEGPRPARVYPKTLEEWGTVLSQDVVRVPKVQLGLRSRSYEGHRLCDAEVRIRHYLAELDRYLGR
jgi:phenylpropionate dioxygenase-like ring-hydroxylating dioxygenase large terminal subunit